MATPFFLFPLGLLFGSFGNVCAWRIPRRESIVFPASHCPSCDAPIQWWQNVPVLSFLLLRGRCARCRAKISWQYPVVELLCGALFAAQGLRFAPGPTLVLGLIASFCLLVLSVIDFHHQIIPDAFSLGLLAVAALASPWNEVLGDAWRERVFAGLIGAAAGYGVMLALAWGGEKVFKQEALGGGDIKLMAAVGALTGWQGIFVTLFLGSLAGTLAAVVLMARRGWKRQQYIPFGPFLALGAWSAWMWGPVLWATIFEWRGLPFR
jgi:leader peptidase (prepilin peptidase)/N-methyltransferase